jgi:hypothetical protein
MKLKGSRREWGWASVGGPSSLLPVVSYGRLIRRVDSRSASARLVSTSVGPMFGSAARRSTATVRNGGDIVAVEARHEGLDVPMTKERDYLI